MKPKIKIAFFDIDGTLHDGASSWELLHVANNTWDTLGQAYLKDYCDGKIDFETFAELDVKAWKDMPEKQFHETLKNIRLYDEVPAVFKYLQEFKILIYIISSGLSQFAHHLCQTFKLDGYVANEVHIENGKLSGGLSLNVPYLAKGNILKEILLKHGLSSLNAIAIGDGEGDIPMFNEVQYPVYYCANNKKLPNYNGFSVSNWQDLFTYIKKL